MICCFCNSLSAHSNGETYSKIYLHENGNVDISYNMPIDQFLQIEGVFQTNKNIEEVFTDLVVPNFIISNHSQPCSTVGPIISNSSRQYIRTNWQVFCPITSTIEIRNTALFKERPAHLHIARFRLHDGRIFEKPIVNHTPLWTIETEAETSVSPFIDYLKFGIDHILGGYDHLAFLLGLILISAQLKSIFWLITGFTVGHSLSLFLAVFGYVTADSQGIEALIGFTVALIAAEIFAKRYGYQNQLIIGFTGLMLLLTAISLWAPDRVLHVSSLTLLGLAIFSGCYLKISNQETRLQSVVKPALTVLFGLIHGFGFAASLLHSDLPNDRMVAALFGFNLGVEIGQILLITLFLTAVYLIFRLWPKLNHWIWTDGAAASLCGLGCFWFLSRSFL